MANAEVISVLNTESNNRCDDDPGAVTQGPNGIFIWGDPNDTWVSARRIWNQFPYRVTNVYEDGTLPLIEPDSWRDYNGRRYKHLPLPASFRRCGPPISSWNC